MSDYFSFYIGLFISTSYFLGRNPGITESFGSCLKSLVPKWPFTWGDWFTFCSWWDGVRVSKTVSSWLFSSYDSLWWTRSFWMIQVTKRLSDESGKLAFYIYTSVIQANSLLWVLLTFVWYYYFVWCGILHNSFPGTHRRATSEGTWSFFDSHTTSFWRGSLESIILLGKLIVCHSPNVLNK